MSATAKKVYINKFKTLKLAVSLKLGNKVIIIKELKPTNKPDKIPLKNNFLSSLVGSFTVSLL